MATFTTNYNLRKPADADFIENDTDLNANFDTIDTEIKLREDEITALETRATALEAETKIVRKTADETVTSSTTLQNDDHLSFAVEAGKTYVFDLVLRYVSPTAADLKWDFTFPGAGLMFNALDSYLDTASAFATLAQTTSTSPTTTRTAGGSGASGLALVIHNSFVCDTNGTVQFRWAQNTSDASGTTVYAGSYLSITEQVT